MRAGETELQMCVRHVADQETRIARQEALIERLREKRSALLDDALQLLDDMHGFLDLMRAHVARRTLPNEEIMFTEINPTPNRGGRLSRPPGNHDGLSRCPAASI